MNQEKLIKDEKIAELSSRLSNLQKELTSISQELESLKEDDSSRKYSGYSQIRSDINQARTLHSKYIDKDNESDSYFRGGHNAPRRYSKSSETAYDNRVNLNKENKVQGYDDIYSGTLEGTIKSTYKDALRGKHKSDETNYRGELLNRIGSLWRDSKTTYILLLTVALVLVIIPFMDIISSFLLSIPRAVWAIIISGISIAIMKAGFKLSEKLEMKSLHMIALLGVCVGIVNSTTAINYATEYVAQQSSAVFLGWLVPVFIAVVLLLITQLSSMAYLYKVPSQIGKFILIMTWGIVISQTPDLYYWSGTESIGRFGIDFLWIFYIGIVFFATEMFYPIVMQIIKWLSEVEVQEEFTIDLFRTTNSHLIMYWIPLFVFGRVASTLSDMFNWMSYTDGVTHAHSSPILSIAFFSVALVLMLALHMYIYDDFVNLQNHEVYILRERVVSRKDYVPSAVAQLLHKLVITLPIVFVIGSLSSIFASTNFQWLPLVLFTIVFITICISKSDIVVPVSLGIMLYLFGYVEDLIFAERVFSDMVYSGMTPKLFVVIAFAVGVSLILIVISNLMLNSNKNISASNRLLLLTVSFCTISSVLTSAQGLVLSYDYYDGVKSGIANDYGIFAITILGLLVLLSLLWYRHAVYYKISDGTLESMLGTKAISISEIIFGIALCTYICQIYDNSISTLVIDILFSIVAVAFFIGRERAVTGSRGFDIVSSIQIKAIHLVMLIPICFHAMRVASDMLYREFDLVNPVAKILMNVIVLVLPILFMYQAIDTKYITKVSGYLETSTSKFAVKVFAIVRLIIADILIFGLLDILNDVSVMSVILICALVFLLNYKYSYRKDFCELIKINKFSREYELSEKELIAAGFKLSKVDIEKSLNFMYMLNMYIVIIICAIIGVSSIAMFGAGLGIFFLTVYYSISSFRENKEFEQTL